MMRTTKIMVIVMLHSAAWLIFAPGRIAAQDEKIAGWLDSLIMVEEKQGFHGNVFISVNKKKLLVKGYGMANESTGLKFDPSTLVQIGSNVKDFTKVAVFQLIEKGKLHPGDTLGMFIPGLPPSVNCITVEHLLNHRSGLPLAMGGDDYPLTEMEMLQNLKTLKLLFPSGRKEHYSNIGYSLLAYLIEKITGETYDVYIARHILKPAGMNETGSYLPGFDRNRIAHGYIGNKDNGIILDMPHDDQGHYWNLRGNGGYLSTLGDMHKFYAALEDNTLLTNIEHRRKVFARDESTVLAGSDGVCFFLFANLPALGAEIIIASNHSNYHGNQLFKKVQAFLGNGNTKNQPVDASLAEKLPDNITGETLGAYLAAYNSGDTAVIHDFFNRYAVKGGSDSPPVNARIERYMEMFENIGRLTLKGFRQSAMKDGWEVHVDTESGERVILTFMLEHDPPNKLKGIMVIAGD